jgi:hypothetical protein
MAEKMDNKVDNINISSSKSDKILQLAKATIQSFSAHGIPKIASHENRLVKVIWLVFFLASAGTCAWFIQMTISNYLSYPVITNTNIVHQKNMIFPIVSICNLNAFTDDSTSQYVSSLISTSPSETLYYDNGNFLLEKIFANELRKNESDNSFGISDLSDVVLSCSFSGLICNLSQDFEPFYDVIYGNCFRFNSGKTVPFKTVKNAGLIGALMIELYIGMASKNNVNFTFANGFNIFINNETVDSTSREGVSVSSGTYTKIIVDKYTISKQPKPYSPCTSDLNTIDSYSSPVYKRLMSYSWLKYHFVDCKFMCMQKFTAEKCKCYDSFLNYVFYPNMSFCKSKQEVACMINYETIFESSSEILQSCDCPLECDYSDYTFTNSWAEYPTYNYYDRYLKNNSLIRSKFGNHTEMNYENVRKSVAKVSIFFNDLRDTVISESVKTSPADLVSSIGGTLGMFVGMSLLSIIDVLELLVQSMAVLFGRSKVGQTE